MKPIHGDTVSNDSSSSTWCSYSNQSALSFRRLSSLQGARTDHALKEKYIPLKENNLLEKLVKTRVLYEGLRHQILSSNLNASSKGILVSGTQPLVVGKHLFKANISKIIQLVDLVDKGVILRPEKLCECCASSNYNSKTRYKYGSIERKQRQNHTGGYLTSKSSIISKKRTIGESRLEIRFKTKNIKSDPCTFKFKEFIKQKSRQALKKNLAVQPLNIDGLLNKKSHKLIRSKPYSSDGVRLSVSKIKQKPPIKEIKNSITKKSLDTVTSRLHFLKMKPCCCLNVTQNTSTTDHPIGIVNKEISHQTKQNSNSKIDMKLNQTCYVENWNYNFECASEMCPRDNSERQNHMMAYNFSESLPLTSGVKLDAKYRCNREPNTKNLKQNKNFSVLSQTIKSKENFTLVLQEQNSTHLASKISMLLTSCKHSARLLTIDSMSKVHSGLLLKETNSKTIKKSKIFSNGPVESSKTCATKNLNSYKNISMSPVDCTDVDMNLLASNGTVLKKRSLERNKHSNCSQDTSRKQSNIRFNFSSNLVKCNCFSKIEKDNITENKYTKLDHVRQKIQGQTSLCDKSIVDPFSYAFAQHHKEERNLDRKLHEHRPKRISKSIKIGSHPLKRCFCSLKLKTMDVNNERHQITYINNSSHCKTSIKIKKRLPREVFLCASGRYVRKKCDSWKIHYDTGSKLISKSLTALEQYRTITNLLEVKASHYKSCKVATSYKNILENSWSIQNKKPEIECSLDKTHNYLYTFKETNTSDNIIPKITKLSKSTIVSLDHIVPKRVSKESEFVVAPVPSLTKYQHSSNFITGVITINNAENTFTPSVKRRNAKSGTSRLQPVYKLLEINKIQSIASTYSYSHLIKNNTVSRKHLCESQEFIVNDRSATKEFFAEPCLSTHNINHENPENIHKKETNTLKSNWKGSPLLKKYKLVKIQNETYLMIRSSSKSIFSTLNLQNSNDLISENTIPKHKYTVRYIDNRSKYTKGNSNTKGNKAELLIKPRYIQVHTDSCNDSQKSKVYKRAEQYKCRKQVATHEAPHIFYKSNMCDPKGPYESVQYDESYKTKSGNVKNKHKFSGVRNPQKQQSFLKKSSSILSTSSTFAIKSRNLQSNFQNKFKIFHLNSSDQYETLQINSVSQPNTRQRNVMIQFSERSLDIKPSNSSDANIHPSEIVKPINPHLTGISSLLRRCFCTMNLQVGNGRGSSKFKYKLKPYECAPYDCIPYECDPYECQKKIMKRLTRKVSSTQTEKLLKSNSNETSKNKNQESVSMSEPKKSKSRRKVICDCRSSYSPKANSCKVKNEGLRSDRTCRRLGRKTQSNKRKIRNTSSSIGPMLKRCLCTVKLLKNEEKDIITDVNSVSTSTQSTNRGHSIRLNTNMGNNTHPMCHPRCYFVDKYPESKVNGKKSPSDTALSVSSSIQTYNMKRRKRKQIASKSVNEKPVRSKELRKHKRLSTSSTRQAVKVGSTLSFSLEFYKDKTEKKPFNEVYEQENRKYKGHSPNRSFKNLIAQKDRSLTNTGSRTSAIKREQPPLTGSFLKRCFCITKKRSQKRASKYAAMGTEEIIECQCKHSLSKIEYECEKNINKKQSIHKASGTDKHLRGFILKKCDCIKLINKRYSVDKASGVNKDPRLFVSKECETKQVIDNKKYHRSIGSATEKQVTKSKSSSATSSKTSKARILHSSEYKHIKSNLLAETVDNEETLRGSLHRQAVRIGSNFSFEVEFHKDAQFPSDEKIQAAAEAVKETRDKMKDVRQMTAVKNKNRVGSSLYSLSSEINTSNKVPKVAPLIRKCICKCSYQNNESLQNYINKSKHSVHRGTSTPVSRPIPNLHNRGVMTVYKLKTYPYKLAPYECEPGVCIPGECDPYECLKRMNRRHKGSSTDAYSTKSALTTTRPSRKYRDTRVQFSPRDSKPHIKEANTRPRKALRPREGIEVRQKPRQNKTRQAVKIGSNFSFNVEFYKDKSQGSTGRSQGGSGRAQRGIGRPHEGPGGPQGVSGRPQGVSGRPPGVTGRPHGGTGRLRGDIGPKPCPQPCPKKCPKLCPKICPNLFKSSGTDAANVNQKSKKAQHKKGQMHNRESQVWGRKMRSTMTGVGPFLKRCFCTLQLQKRNEKVLPRRVERRDSDSNSVGTETARFRPKPHYREQGTRPRGKQTYHGRKLDPNECEPGVCIPGQCDPYVCLERIKRRDMHTRHTGTGGRHRMRSVASSMTEPGYRRNRNRSVSSSMMDQRRPRGQRTHNQYRNRRNERPNLGKERTAYAPSPTSHRQAVRIGSSFSFNIEFYKDRNEQAPHVSTPIRKRHEHGRPAPVKYIKKPTRTKSMSSSNKHKLKNRRMQVDSKTLLKRCFCTLKLQKIGTHQRQTQESTASIGTYYKAAGAQIRQKQEIVPQYRDFGTKTKRQRLEPFECEPGVCIPGQCDPYECLERIKRRNLMRHLGTSMAYPHTRSMSNLTPYNFKTTSMNTPMGAKKTPGKKDRRKYPESPRRIKQPPPRPSRALENIHNRQAVRLGSSFSFNVEFYKDRSAKSSRSDRSGVIKEAPCRLSVCKGPTCNPTKCKTSTCSVSCPVKGNQRSRTIQYQGGGHDRMVQAKNARTESRGSGVPLLKRCFCTLTLQRAEVNSYMIPLRARLYCEKATSTKNKYFYSESEQQADLRSDYCTPNTCMSDCDPYNGFETVKKRGLRRISRTSGNHMVRSRDVSGGELGSRFRSFDMQSSGWHGRHQPERVETIVEEPRFKFFNRPNTRQTVRISSNFNFNIDFFKDILFPEPREVEEEFDEMSAVTEALNPQHKRKKFREDRYKVSYEGDKRFNAENYRHKHKHKKISEPIYESDKLFSIEHYRPKIRLHKSLNEKGQVENRKISKVEKHLDERSKKMKPEKELDEQSKNSRPEKELDEHSKKSKAEKELDDRSKKLKPEEVALQEIKPGEKTGGPINKILKSFHVSKGDKCACPLDKNGGKKKKEKEKNKHICLCSSNGKKKYKCPCVKTELNGKKISNVDKKSKVAENTFVNKNTTVARVEMNFYKQKSKPSTTRMLPTLNSSTYYLATQPQHAKVTLDQKNENRNDLLCRNVVLLKPKPEYDEPNAFPVCQIPVKNSISKILYLYSPNLFWKNHSRPCSFSSNIKSITSLQVTDEKLESSLALPTRNISAFPSSVNIRAAPTVTLSQNHFNFANNSYTALWLKTKSLHNHPFKTDVPLRIDTKFQMQKNIYSNIRQENPQKSMSLELFYCRITADKTNEIKNRYSGTLLRISCSSQLRKTKSEDVKKTNVCNSVIIFKSKCSTRNTLNRNLSSQVGKMKSQLCESVISAALIDKSSPISVFTPKEYWVQYQIQYPKINKCHKAKQTIKKSEYSEKQPEYSQLETIMPYVPHKFHRVKSKMLFNRVSKLTCNDICCVFCRSNCRLKTKLSSNKKITSFSNGEYHNQLLEKTKKKVFKTSKKFIVIKNQSYIGSIEIEPWDPSRKKLETLICHFIRALSAAKRIRNHCFVLKTSKHCIKFTPAVFYSKSYKSSIGKCSFATSCYKKYISNNKYQRLISSDGVVNFASSCRTGIKLVKKPRGYCQARSKRIYQHRDIPSTLLISKGNSNVIRTYGNETEIFLVQSDSCSILRKNKDKPRYESEDIKSPVQTVSLSSSSFCKSSRSEFVRQRKIPSHSVKLIKATSNLRNLLWCSNCNNYKINNISRSFISNYKNRFLRSKFNEHVYFQKLSKGRKKSCLCYFCKKKCISKYPKLKIKIKPKNAIGCKMSANPLKNNQNHRFESNTIETLTLHNRETCVAKVNKETVNTEDIESNKRDEEEKCECEKVLHQDYIEKSKQIVRNYNYHLFMTKMLICMTKIGLTNRKNAVNANYESNFSLKRAYRHFKCILLNLKIGLKCSPSNCTETHSSKQKRLNFEKTIKDSLHKPTKCLKSFKHVQKLHKRMLPKFLRAPKNTVELRFNSLDIACPQVKPHFSISSMLPRFYPHFLTLVKVWRQLIDVLLFVLWSPCLFSAQLCKAFLCCLIRFRLHCYLK